MKIISFFNQKGGTGKTTTVFNVGKAISMKGFKVLLIDLDSQGSLTYSFGENADNLDFNVLDLLKEKIKFQDLLISKNNIDLLPCNLDASSADMELAGVAGRESMLKHQLEYISEYDYVLIDCPPHIGVLTLNALTASGSVYIPVETQFLATRGFKQLLNTIRVVRERLNKNLITSGIIATKYDARTNLSNDILNTLKENFKEGVLKTKIRINTSLAEAPAYKQSIFEYKPNSNGAEDYMALAEEILKIEGDNNGK